MIDIGNNLDGSVEKAVKASQNMGNAGFLRRTFMTLGDFTIGNAKKVDLKSAGTTEDDPALQKYAAQISVLNDKQQEAVLGMTKFKNGQKEIIQNLVQQIAEGEKLSGVLTEQTLTQNGFSKAAVEGMLKASGLQDAEKQYGLAITSDAIPAMEKWINENESLIDIEQLRKQGIVTGTSGNYQFGESFKGVIANVEADSVATMTLTDIQIAWNAVMQIGKQLLLSLGAAALAFVATEIVKYIANLKSHSEELVAEMEEAHEAANTTASDIDNIKSKIDDLNNSIKDAGAEKIEDIVDPTEREHLQVINDMLQAQLELKEKLQKGQYNANNATTSAVVNDQTEDSIVNFHQSEDIDPTSGKMFTYSEADKVTKTESLQEYTAALEDTIQKRRDLQIELDQIEVSSGKDSKAYANKKKELDALNETFESQKTKVEELSTAVSEQMGNYSTDADNFDQYKDEYVAGTNAMTAATKALADAQDDTSVDTTNVDIFAEKVSAVKASMSRRGTNDSKGNSYIGAVNEFSGMTGDAVLNIDADTEHQTEAESNALKILHETADKAHISFGDLIGVFEQFGFLQVSKVHVPIIREREKLLYTERWPDLEITYNTMINQYAWKFVNKDGAVLDIQYIDKGERAVDPVTRSDNPIPTPTFPSTISTVFTFSGWDTEFTPVFENQIVTAVYDESVRQYRVRYMNRGAVLQQTTAPYGSMVLYDGDTPTYTSEETAYKYYLFSGWDKGGYVNGDKDINAVYDICEYVSGYFRDKQLSDLRPVEIYAMTKVNLEQSVVSDKDAITIKMGNDFTFSDVEEKVLFNEPKIFTGKNYVDTGVSLLAEDRSWVMALDYRIDEDSAANSVIAQCFQTNGMNGFRFWVNNGSKVAWGTESTTGAHLGSRDMIVLRHTKGENGIHVYAANTTAAEIGYIQLNRTRTTQTNATLVFGCAKADDGAYERYAKGTIYWGKLWYTDLGDAACRKLAAWTHEDFTFEACGFKQYYLSDNSNKRCSISFIQAGLLGQKMALNTGSTNTGGWADANIRTFLDGRILNALPIGWQQIIKQVKVGSTIGDKSSEVVTADSYFYLPSVAELFPSQNVEPYIYEGTAISFMTDNTSRICNDENGNPAAYWTRSPNAQYGSYFWSVTVTGEYYGFTPANNEQGIRLMFSV